MVGSLRLQLSISQPYTSSTSDSLRSKRNCLPGLPRSLVRQFDRLDVEPTTLATQAQVSLSSPSRGAGTNLDEFCAPADEDDILENGSLSFPW